MQLLCTATKIMWFDHWEEMQFSCRRIASLGGGIWHSHDNCTYIITTVHILNKQKNAPKPFKVTFCVIPWVLHCWRYRRVFSLSEMFDVSFSPFWNSSVILESDPQQVMQNVNFRVSGLPFPLLLWIVLPLGLPTLPLPWNSFYPRWSQSRRPTASFCLITSRVTRNTKTWCPRGCRNKKNAVEE